MEMCGQFHIPDALLPVLTEQRRSGSCGERNKKKKLFPYPDLNPGTSVDQPEACSLY
jgi:hypothetical protein